MNNSKLISRKLKESDWDTLKQWWDYWPRVEAPDKGFLPDNGTGGLMVEDDGIPVIAGFIYQTNSNAAMLEYVISNPKYRGRDKRDAALEKLIISLQVVAENLGFKNMFTMVRSKKFINLRGKFGGIIDPRPNYTIIKAL